MKLIITENLLSPFNKGKTQLKKDSEDIFKTKDAKAINIKVLTKISNNFIFQETSNLLNTLFLTTNPRLIVERQNYFRNVKKGINNTILNKLKKPRPSWGPKYGIVAVTDDEGVFSQLKNIDIPVKYLLNEDDVLELQNYDIVQVVEIENFRLALEQLPQSVFIDSIDDVYLERYLEALSGWKENFKILETIDDENIRQIIEELSPVLRLIDLEKKEKVSRIDIENIVKEINEEVFEKVKQLNIQGESLFRMLSENKMPPELEKVIDESIKKVSIPTHFLESGMPVRINEHELEEFLKLQDANQNTDFASKLKKFKQELKKVPELIKRLESEILIFDLKGGVQEFITQEHQWPLIDEEVHIEDAKNLFLKNAQSISFRLSNLERCSILTGANSGGKTTLIEHLLQIISLMNMGLPIKGSVRIPLFSEIYYFAKNKGSASKGAFETLLTQMSKISPGNKTLILADEIEAVTEPGVAGKIINATSEYFIDKNCYLIIATHLGHEIKKSVPKFSRIDGIEATGLDENNELIVNHNPVLGRIANSTPELIVEKMAKTLDHEYFRHIHEYLKKTREVEQ